MQQHPVVVGVDGSPASTNAVLWAIREAELRALPLHVLHAYGWGGIDLPLNPDAYAATYPHASTAIRDQAERLTEETVARIRTIAPGLAVTTTVAPDLPSLALVDASRTATVVVLGSRGLGGFTGLLLGSVGVQVSAHANCPVVIVRDPVAETRDGIVVGVDGSPPSNAAVAYAFAQASWRGTNLIAVHAWRWPTSTGPGDQVPLVYSEAETRPEEERFIAEALAGWTARYPDVPVTRRVVRMRPAAAIVAESATALLTVVGSRGHGGFTGLLLGSVSQQVLHHAGSPVALVHAG